MQNRMKSSREIQPAAYRLPPGVPALQQSRALILRVALLAACLAFSAAGAFGYWVGQGSQVAESLREVESR